MTSARCITVVAALTAVSKWKYQPQMADGKPVEAPGIKVLLTFKMDS